MRERLVYPLLIALAAVQGSGVAHWTHLVVAHSGCACAHDGEAADAVDLHLQPGGAVASPVHPDPDHCPVCQLLGSLRCTETAAPCSLGVVLLTVVPSLRRAVPPLVTVSLPPTRAPPA